MQEEKDGRPLLILYIATYVVFIIGILLIYLLGGSNIKQVLYLKWLMVLFIAVAWAPALGAYYKGEWARKLTLLIGTVFLLLCMAAASISMFMPSFMKSVARFPLDLFGVYILAAAFGGVGLAYFYLAMKLGRAGKNLTADEA